MIETGARRSRRGEKNAENFRENGNSNCRPAEEAPHWLQNNKYRKA